MWTVKEGDPVVRLGDQDGAPEEGQADPTDLSGDQEEVGGRSRWEWLGGERVGVGREEGKAEDVLEHFDGDVVRLGRHRA